MRRRIILSALVGTLVATGGGTAHAANAHERDSAMAHINQARVQAGCQPLRTNGHLQIAATRHSQEMAALKRFSHRGAGNTTPQRRASLAGYGSSVAENIAAGQRTGQQVARAWLRSPGHRANLLNCNLRSAGLGTATGGTYGVYWTLKMGRI